MSARQARNTNPPISSATANRQNEYFVPRDGIDREVITADICRYLGNDALVRPGTYEDNGRVIQGYYITAYRNLTTAMIADLKADSARWEQERRKHHSGGVPRYSDSQYRDQKMQSSGYDGGYSAGASYDQTPRYPGSDAPGYSAGSAYSQGYGAQPSYAAQPQYQAQAYAQPTTDTRYTTSQATTAAYGSTGYGAQQPPESYIGVGAHRPSSSRPEYSSMDVDHQAPPSTRNMYATATTQPSYSAAPAAYAYQQPQVASNTGFATTSHPMDPFYGRRPYNSQTPVSQGTGEYVTASPSGTTSMTGYSPVPEPQQYEETPNRPAPSSTSSAQLGAAEPSSNQPRREDRPTEKHARHHYSSSNRR